MKKLLSSIFAAKIGLKIAIDPVVAPSLEVSEFMDSTGQRLLE